MNSKTTTCIIMATLSLLLLAHSCRKEVNNQSNFNTEKTYIEDVGSKSQPYMKKIDSAVGKYIVEKHDNDNYKIISRQCELYDTFEFVKYYYVIDNEYAMTYSVSVVIYLQSDSKEPVQAPVLNDCVGDCGDGECDEVIDAQGVVVCKCDGETCKLKKIILD